MKGTFAVAQKELLTLLSSMQPICAKRTTLDITESILFHVAPRELTLKATDMEISLQSNMVIEGDFEEQGSFLIAGKRIFDLVKEIDGEITFTVKPNQLQLKSQGVDLALNIKNADEFPPFPERIENMMEIDASFLLHILNKVAFVIPQNNANPALNGMLLELTPEHMSLVATDGHCLAYIKTEKYTLAESRKWLLPKRAVLELKKILESNSVIENVFLGTCGQQLVFSGKNFNFFTRLIAEPFPEYSPVLDREGFISAKLIKDPLVKTLKRTNCMLSGQFVSTSFTFGEKAIRVNLHNKDVGKLDEKVAVEDFKGDAIESRFYSPYLLNGLQVFPAEKIDFFIKSAVKPIIFEAKEKDFSLTYLVMPVSLSQS